MEEQNQQECMYLLALHLNIVFFCPISKFIILNDHSCVEVTPGIKGIVLGTRISSLDHPIFLKSKVIINPNWWSKVLCDIYKNRTPKLKT